MIIIKIADAKIRSLTLDPPIGMGASIEDTRKIMGGNLAHLLDL